MLGSGTGVPEALYSSEIAPSWSQVWVEVGAPVGAREVLVERVGLGGGTKDVLDGAVLVERDPEDAQLGDDVAERNHEREVDVLFPARIEIRVRLQRDRWSLPR